MAEGDEKRTLIETYLPVEEISEEAKIEKLGNAKPPSSTLHYWWTRKPLIASRAAVLGALLPSDFDIQEFKRLLGLEYVSVSGKRAYHHSLSEERIAQLKQEYRKVWGEESPLILDPFAGGGSIPLEALRVGANVIANDYNPVANLILKATLEYPPKYGESLYKDVKKGLDWIFNETKNELEGYYPKHNGKDVTAYIWAWGVKCPECGFENPLVGQWWLCRKPGKNIFLDYDKPTMTDSRLKYTIREGTDPPSGNCSGGKAVCIRCGASISNELVQKEIKELQKEHLLAVVVQERRGKGYELPNDDDFVAMGKTNDIVQENIEKWIKDGIVPDNDIPQDTRGSLSVRLYLPKWRFLLNSRQLLLFSIIERKIFDYAELLSGKENEERLLAILTYLSFVLGKHIDYNCRSTTWHRANEQIAHVLTFRGVGMTWDHAEVNPFVKGSGTLPGLMGDISNGLNFAEHLLRSKNNITISSKSVTEIETPTKLIISDPPYFDDVRYAEFSEFFYAWERIVLKNLKDPGDIPSKEEMSVGGWGRTQEFFSKLFLISAKKLNNILDDKGLLVLFFAHSSVDAWDFVINALRKSGFRITATWPIHTESTTNPLARGNASIMSSIIIVARKRKQEKSGYIEEIHDELQDHLSHRLDEFWKYGLRGADLTVASMGATLDIITQYSEIKSYTGEMTIKDVLELVQDSVTQYVLQRYMKNAGSLDAPTAFYLYARFSGLEGMPFDTANLIAKSMKIDLKVLEKEHLIESVKSKKTSGVKIQTFKDREDLYRRTIPMSSMINAVHYMMAAFAHGGYDEVQQVLTTIPYGRNEIRDILEAFQSLPPGDPERQVAQQILERMGTHFPKTGQQSLDQY